MNIKNRATRIAMALSITALIVSQIPMRGETALGSVQQPNDGYPSNRGDNSGSFLGIRGLTNRNAITGVGLGLLGLGVYSTIIDSRSATAAAGATSGVIQNGILTGVSSKPIYDVLIAMPDDFSETVKLIDAAGLPDILRDDTPYTFFAPTNAATGLIPSQFRQPENKEALIKLIKRHTIPGRYTISQLLAMKNGSVLKTLSGESAIITNRNGELRINNVLVGQNDIPASNGFIHPIEAPLDEEN
jgi:uncharacterized surface protein with fasciclin (FAS1) repeats